MTHRGSRRVLAWIVSTLSTLGACKLKDAIPDDEIDEDAGLDGNEPEGDDASADGNEPEGDGCPGNCMAAVCGDGIVDRAAGEVCEGPQVARIGEGESFSCSADCMQKEPYACADCQNAECTDYQGLGMDLVAGCFDNVNTEYGADAGDAAFIQQCVALVNCALTHRCGLGEGEQPSQCYCGSNSVEECAIEGPAEDAPCVREFQAAARSERHAEIYNAYTDTSRPIGWAYLLLECYTTKCPDTCVPR